MAKMNLVLGRFRFSRVVDGVFSAPVTLPAGRKIEKVTYYHYGARSPYSNLRFMRVRTGETPEKLANESSTDAAAKAIPVDVPITGDPIIRGGCRYYILVSVNPATFFEGVKITHSG